MRMPKVAVLGLTLLVSVGCFSAAMLAPDHPSGSAATAPEAPAQNERAIEKQEQSQRMLKAVPLFLVTDRQDASPLSPTQKFHLAVKGIVDPFEFFAVGLEAGASQAENQFPAYGQGAAGYGKRYGAALADEASSGMFVNFAYPVLLKEDPRYFRLGSGSFRHRFGYALAQEFVCHTDRGGRSFNWSTVLGGTTAGSLSNLYYPPADRGLGLTLSRAGISLLYGSAGGLVEEFWPDISRKLHRRGQNHPVDGQTR